MSASDRHFANRTLDEFTADLAAKTSVPGGGAAAGSMLAHAAGLGGMVIAFSHGKKKFVDFESDLAEAAGRLERIRDESLELADLDAQGFKALADLWPLAEDDPVRVQAWPAAVHGALAAPHQLVLRAAETVRIIERLVGRSSTLLRSDLAIAGRLAGFAAEAAGWNVDMNLSSLRGLDDGAPLAIAMETKTHEAIRAAITGAAAIDAACRAGGRATISS
ncbi:MAG: cyclodeaminase/cyclohydrolase family protein [Planctomycetota bacterium]|nr:cyclodeaminase/cyclohydrolase family protein [Planctomycetota bacterium]MDA1025355.1 cyclodeaminase/cyclohydrolase family protein [Planctomycetota bacterium]